MPLKACIVLGIYQTHKQTAKTTARACHSGWMDAPSTLSRASEFTLKGQAVHADEPQYRER